MNICRQIAVIFPMAGEGKRFHQHGDNIKPLIKISGKLMFQYAVDSALNHLDGFDVKLVFVIRDEQEKKHQLGSIIKKHYPNARVEVLPRPTRGALETVLQGSQSINQEMMLWSIDCDLQFSCLQFAKILPQTNKGALLTFKSQEEKYSYVLSDQQNTALKVREKEVISNMAIAGAYLFPSISLFQKHAQEIINKQETTKNEFYISQVVDRLINKNVLFKVYQLDEYQSFGTPEELATLTNQ